ncbi:hypothetical protein [Streptomyces sp. MAR4 CNX-425]|uniref:hypothetical protein n=1 Tax=Streptomyces sp. MAR4 CNX-425 TaxID=3406343 RepID=UPI003B507552
MSVLHAVWRRRPNRSAAARAAREQLAGRILEDLAAALPDEDLGEDLAESLELYRVGSKPRCEEVEYLDLLEEAVERLAWGR